ncbi:MAG TPA: hypothetical protein VGH83_01040 [Candidatus Acidoferrum sp.]|jgi:hypothetical protein
MSSAAIRRAPPALPINASLATAQIFPLASNSLLACAISAPGKLALEAKRFTVRAEGNAQTSGAFTVKASIYGIVNTLPTAPLTPGSWTLLGSGTARTVSTAWSPWWIQCDLIYDSNSGLLQGIFSQMLNNLFDTGAAITNQLTGINGSNIPILQGATTVQPFDPTVWFAAALTFGTASATNVGNLSNFEIAF